MPEKREIEISIGKARFGVRLNETKTAARLLASLPLQGEGDFWGDEIYFDIGVELAEESPKTEVDVGDVAYWRPGPRSASSTGRPRRARRRSRAPPRRSP